MILETELRGTKLDLKTLQEADASDSYLAWLNDPEINAFLEVRRNPPSTINDLSKFINECLRSDSDLLLGIFSKNDLHIGNIKISFNWDNLRSEIGIIVGDRSFWGKGVATEAIKLVTQFLLEKHHVRRVSAGLYEKNVGSQKAFEKAGFKLEGVFRNYWYFNEESFDQCFYSFNRSVKE
jgi:ribosomal-protein-alanine N-acetyltransferase